MIKRDWFMGIGTIIGAMAGVFVGAGADATWASLSSPTYIIGSIVAGAAALVAWRAKPPQSS